jgi:hypothetical protein
MPAQIGENRARRMLKANELVLCMGANQWRTPNIAIIAAACGFDDLDHNPSGCAPPLRVWRERRGVMARRWGALLGARPP